jgi:NAD(P)-dependent dehydrogenase (short-subunit alcohol dehydrogenase family)
MRLENKVAIVTGGATGIGRAIARRFAAEGAKVTIADINTEQGQHTADDCAGLFVACDTSQPGAVRQMVQQTTRVYGDVDVLVNSAAHLGGMNTVADMPENEWRDVMAVTLDGVFHCSKYAVQAMLRRGGGSIIHIASVEGMMGVASHAAYVSGKSALFGLTRSMAIDFGPHNIRVNAISPGIIDSARPDITRLKQNEAVMKFWHDMTVLKRLGQPEEVAATALFLASDEAAYITGQNIAVDGGWTIGHPPLSLPQDAL